jgi:hypothetical protein
VIALVTLSTGAGLALAAIAFVAIVLAFAFRDYRGVCRRLDERPRHPKAEPVDYGEALRPTGGCAPTSDERWGGVV